MYASLNPFSVKDLLRAHGTMMMAPPAERVPQLIDDLFEWLTNAEDHLLIRSCVFHYEFEFIHPFSDGNGRTGRLWQSLILGRLNPLFAKLPVENMIYSNQEAYYDAIAESTVKADSGPFIDFMLGEILKTLKDHQGAEQYEYSPNESSIDKQFGVIFGKQFGKQFGDTEKQLLLLLNSNPTLSAHNLADNLGITKRAVEKQIKKLRDLQVLSRPGSAKNGLWLINAEY